MIHNDSPHVAAEISNAFNEPKKFSLYAKAVKASASASLTVLLSKDAKGSRINLQTRTRPR
jgi:hypothetical protein